MIYQEHIEVLQTMQRAGFLDKKAVKTVKGQILKANPLEAELLLRRVIKNASKRSKQNEKVKTSQKA